MGSTVRGKRSAPKESSKASKKAKVSAVADSASGTESESDSANSASSDDLDSDDSKDELDLESEDELDEAEDDKDDLDIDDEEDELDVEEDDDVEQDISEGSGESESTPKEVDPNKKSSREQHAEQRKLLQERKLQRKSGVEIQKIKTLWEKLRVKKPAPSQEVRDRLSNEIWDLSKDVIADLVLKHDALRVVQTLIKFASKDRRDLIVKALQGDYYRLATSSYGKYLLVKLLHYGSKELRTLIVNELHGKLRKLMRHREGAYVVEDLYVLYLTAEQRKQMVREFWGAEYAVFRDSGKGKSVVDVCNELSEKKQLITANLIGTITASVEKGLTGFQILHAAMKDYVSILFSNMEQNETKIREFIELLQEQFAELVHTNEGCEVACRLIAVATAKERKILVKSLKQHAIELIKNENGNLVLITLFMTVDDTVMVHKAFVADLFTDDLFPPLLQDKFLRRPVIYLLKGLDGKYFAPNVKQQLLDYEKLAYAASSKKPQEQRRTELLEKALPLANSVLINSSKPDFKFPDLSLAHILALNIGAQTVSEIVQYEAKGQAEVIDAVFELTVGGDVLEDHHLLNKSPFITRLVKALIQGREFHWDNATKKLVHTPEGKLPGLGAEFAAKVAAQIFKSVDSWTAGQPAFVVVSTLEALDASGRPEAAELRSALKKKKKALQKEKDDKGAQLLVKLL